MLFTLLWKRVLVVLAPLVIGGILVTMFFIPIHPASEFENIDVDLNFDEDFAYNHVEAQVNFGDRHPGTENSADCQQYFIDSFADIGNDLNYYPHSFTVESTNCKNLLFKLNEDHSNIIIIAAHYDSRAKATKDETNPDSHVPGANDGASSCAVIIELARVFYEKRDVLDCQLWFLFFDAEDQGPDPGGKYAMPDWEFCEGSNKFVSDLSNFYEEDTENLDAMILLDMVGGENLEFIDEQRSTSPLLDEIFQVGRALGYTDEFPTMPESNSIFDDHVAFLEVGIPAADLIINFWSNPDWPYHHTTEDDMSHISKTSLAVTGKTVEQFIYNNYYTEKNQEYDGNFPWDSNFPIQDLIILFIGIIGIVAGVIIAVKLIRKNAKMINSKSNQRKIRLNYSFNFVI
ncbi:MAG: M28 family peptidase [Promethearchaeia archaeon]